MPTHQPYFRMAGLALFLLPESLPVTARRSLPAASSRLHQISGAGGRARRIYLFREEYIFDVEKAVVVETPQLGHATYVFAKPRNMDNFLALYIKIKKDDIRRNRNTVSYTHLRAHETVLDL